VEENAYAIFAKLHRHTIAQSQKNFVLQEMMIMIKMGKTPFSEMCLHPLAANEST